MTAPVTIVGAGIGGLVLGRALLRRGIQCTIRERQSKGTFDKRHGYAIELKPWAYRPLLEELEMTEANFRARVAVDGSLSSGTSPTMRVHRGRLERMIAEKLTDSTVPSGFIITFDAKDEVPLGKNVVVVADGAHSQVREKCIPRAKFQILPFCVLYGTRRIGSSEFAAEYAQHFKQAQALERVVDGVLLRIGLTGSIANDLVGINYTWSRMASGKDDPLFNPSRSKGESEGVAKSDPFAEAIESFKSTARLDGIFKNIFNLQNMKDDRKLHWLMRSVLVKRADLQTTAGDSKVILIGDAAHHNPIIGSDGANDAIKDAIELADFLSQSKMKETLEDINLQDFYALRFDDWAQENDDAKSRLFSMHGQEPGHDSFSAL